MTNLCKHDTRITCVYCMLAKFNIPEDRWLTTARNFYAEKKTSYGGEGCDLCKGVDEPYMLSNKVWKTVIGKSKKLRFLCLKCVEAKLCRSLRLKDFTDNPINYGALYFDCRAYIGS